MIQAFLLGSPRILLNGEMVVFPFKQVEALLYYLLVEGAASRARLASLIWGDRGDEQRVRSNMRNAAYVLRKLFGKDFLAEPQKNLMGISPVYPVELDLDQITSGGPLADYPGDFLEDFYLKDNEYFNEWLLSTRQRMNRLALEQLKLGAERSFAAQDWDQCERLYLRLLSLDEFDEAVYCRLMELYRARGEYSKALSLYRQMKRLFTEELFQLPGEEADQLLRSIKALRNQKIAASMTGRLEEKQPVPENHSLFFGRADEVRRLQLTITEFLNGNSPASPVIIGETGIGKTSLIEHVLDRFSEQEDAVIFRSRCYRAEEAYALKPWQGIFEQVIAHFQACGPERLTAPFSRRYPMYSHFWEKRSMPPGSRMRLPRCATAVRST